MGPKRGREEEVKVIEVVGAKMSFEEAKAIVDAACSEANDVMETMKDPEKNKKTKTLKQSTKEDVMREVMTGDPKNVLLHIKSHKKEFISGVYSSVFMSAIRKEMSDAEGKKNGEKAAASAAGNGDGESDAKRAKTEDGDAKVAEAKAETEKETKNGADEAAG